MKINIQYNQSCSRCGNQLIFEENNRDDFGCYTFSLFFCNQCQTHFPIVAGEFVAEVLNDDTVLFPDEIINLSIA